jgi:hypothetical protein
MAQTFFISNGYFFFIPLTLTDSNHDDPVKSLKRPFLSFRGNVNPVFSIGLPGIPACAGMTTFYESVKSDDLAKSHGTMVS